MAYSWMLPSILLRNVRRCVSCASARFTVISVSVCGAAAVFAASFAAFEVRSRTWSLTSLGFWSAIVGSWKPTLRTESGGIAATGVALATPADAAHSIVAPSIQSRVALTIGIAAQ